MRCDDQIPTYPLSRIRVQPETLAKARLLELAASPDELERVVAFPPKGGALPAGGLLLVALPPPSSALLAPLPRSFTWHKGQREELPACTTGILAMLIGGLSADKGTDWWFSIFVCEYWWLDIGE
jgi:hypothetical protein